MDDTTTTIAWRYRCDTYCPPCLIDALIILRLAGPAALDMDPAQVVDQVTEANALSPTERPHPLTTIQVAPGQRCDACHEPLAHPPSKPDPSADMAPLAAPRHVTVLLNVNPTGLSLAFGYVIGDPLHRAYDYDLDAPDVDLEDIAEQAFGVFNGMPTNEWERHHTERYYAAENRSFSVGDVIVIDRTAFACQRTGFTPIPLPAETT
jgi:hypothetical protein